MISEIFKSKPHKKELRKFTITICAALSIIGGIILWQKGDTGFIFLAVGLLFLFSGLIKPELLGPIYKVWMAFSLMLGFVMNHLILALMYYIVITPIGILMRVLRKDPLQTRLDRNTKSYWLQRTNEDFSKEKYEKMF
jgi:large-conductance mechanosensitive channel